MKHLIAILFAACALAQTGSWPTVATDQDLVVAKTGATSTLAVGVNASTLTVVVADGSKFAQYSIIRIDDEYMQICSIATNTLTICSGTRGLVGSAASHLNGAAVRDVVSEYHHNRTRAEIKAMQAKLLPATAGTTAPGTCAADRELFADTDDLTISVCNGTGDGWNAITSGSSGSGVRVCATAGTSTAYTCAVTGSIATNDLLLLVPHTASGSTPTLNVNSGGAVGLYRRSGNAVGADYLASGSAYLLRKAASTWVITEQDITVGANGTLSCTNGVCDTTALVCATTGACTRTGATDYSGASTTAVIRLAASDPATCDATKREMYFDTATNALKSCNSTNTWTAVGGGASSITEYPLFIGGVGTSGSNLPMIHLVTGAVSYGRLNVSPSMLGAVEFARGAPAVAEAQIYTFLPSTWTGTITLQAFTTLAADSSGTGTYVLGVRTLCVTPGTDTLNGLSSASFNAAQTMEETIGTIGAGQIGKLSTTATLTTTGCSAGDLLFIRLIRDAGTWTNDTATDKLLVGFVRLAITRTL